MAPHRFKLFVKFHRPTYRWAMGCLAALLVLSTFAPMDAHAQTILPVVIKLPPSFLRSVPDAKMDAAVFGSVQKAVGAPEGVARMVALHNTEVRATELRGILPHQFDHHYFELEASKPGGAFALTMVVEPGAVLEDNAVNFVVLTEDGMKKVAAGVDPVAVKTTMGSPFLFDQVGNRLTALVPGSDQSKYTVVVFNNGKMPTTYTLRVDGGLLIDDDGQTFSAIKVSAPHIEEAKDPSNLQLVNSEVTAGSEVSVEAILAKYDGVAKRFGLVKQVETRSIMERLLPEPVRARQVSGVLASWQDRHYLNLAMDTGGGELTLTLRYEAEGGLPTHLNFWVLTQDGVRHLIQGALPQELNLAMGLPVVGQAGVYQARIRVAQNMLYTVVVYSEGMTSADYTLAVHGGILVDRYGQTREAQAAEMEVVALANN